jgi:hypothetical protein
VPIVGGVAETVINSGANIVDASGIIVNSVKEVSGILIP